MASLTPCVSGSASARSPAAGESPKEMQDMKAVVATDRGAQEVLKEMGEDYRQNFVSWKSELVRDRKENWLPLVGLFELKQGKNSFGSDDSNTIVFPGVPASVGDFVLEGERVILRDEEL